MSTKDPQFIYMVLILPTLFGLTLFGEGLNKIIKNERMGWTSVVMGLLFILAVVYVFVFFLQQFDL